MKKLIILLSVLLVLGSACKKDFLSVDEKNPNSASAVPANLILPAALKSVAAQVDQPDNYSFIYLLYGQWCVMNGYVQPTTMTRYDFLNSSFQGIWDNSYLILQNFDYVAKASTSPQQNYFRAISLIMEVYLYHNLVDAYGNIPYSQALQGASQVLKPVYDPQQTVYEDLVSKIDTAINLIKTAPVDVTPVAGADIIYNGDMGKWSRFGNTIKLRMLMNQADMTDRSAYITAALATTIDVGFLGAGEGAMANPGYLQTAGKMNPFWENFYKQDNSQQADGLAYYGAGQDMCTFLTANNDPRKLRFWLPITGSPTTIQGNHFGAQVLLSVPNTSHLGNGYLLAYNMSAPILTDFESLFLQAEAAQRGFLGAADPKALYESAVTQSILYVGQKSSLDASSYVPLTSTDAATYLAQNKDLVNFDASADKIKAIITQKWVALAGISAMPVWTDYRRTGFPDFIHFSDDPLRKSDTPLIRLLYPQTEISTNNDNVVLQGTINQLTSKIFWQNR